MEKKTFYMESLIPTIDEFNTLQNTSFFKNMEKYADSFLLRNEKQLGNYIKRWVRDPLHQWSRIWEYPFVYANIEKFLTNENVKEASILDAGSGATFFPYYLDSHPAVKKVYCCDYDEELKIVHKAIQEKEQKNVSFRYASLHKTNFDDHSFEAIYCISVLEHTDNYDQIINEFYRVLKPGGKLLVTFDISLDGKEEISPSAAENLILSLKRKFYSDYEEVSLKTLLSKPNLLTTGLIYQQRKELIPWKKPSLTRQIKSLLGGKGFATFPPPFSVYSTSLTKK